MFKLTTVSKNTYDTGFMGSFPTPNPHRPLFKKYVTCLTTTVEPHFSEHPWDQP